MNHSEEIMAIRIKKSCISLLTCCTTLLFSSTAYGQLPTGGQVVSGSATISQPSASSMVINQASQSAIMNWTSFSIGSGSSVNFVQPNTSAVAVNRVNTENPSEIFGALSANGPVFLLTPSGKVWNKNGPVFDASSYSSDELLAILTNFSRSSAASITESATSTISTALATPGTVMTGLHHHPLMRMKFPDGKNCFWATGDILDSVKPKITKQIGEIGICHDFPNRDIRVGIGIGTNKTVATMSHGGKLDIHGNHLYLEVDSLIFKDVLVSLSGMYGWSQSDIRRNYPSLFSGQIDTSVGSTKTDSLGFRLRTDWLNAIQIGRTSLSPYFALSELSSKQNSYSETGGASPTRYDSATLHSRMATLGTSLDMQVSSAINGRINIENLQNLDENSKTTMVINGTPIALGTNDQKSNFWRIGLDADYSASKKSIFSGSVIVSNATPKPTWIGSVGWRTSF